MIDFNHLEKEYGTDLSAVRAVCMAEPGKLSPFGKIILQREVERTEQANLKSLSTAEIDAGRHLMAEKEKAGLEASLVKRLDQSRKDLQNRIRTRIENGRDLAMRNYRYFMAADLAWDGPPIQPANLPIDLYAQGKIDLPSCVTMLKEACKQTKENVGNYITKDADGKETISPQQHRLSDTTLNLVRPFIRRSVAAQTNRYNRLYPLFSYDPRSRSLVGKLRGELVSQRAEIMADQLGYRHLTTQMIRRMFLHGGCTAFWDVWMKEFTVDSNGRKTDREGVLFHCPHPTRIFYDLAHSLSSINTDTGCQFLGYWDVVTFGEIRGSRKWFNLNKIPRSSSLDNLFTSFRSYLDYYLPTMKGSLKITDKETEKNQRDSNQAEKKSACYGTEDKDEAVSLVHYYERIIPSEEGFGHYPYPVWMHFVVAGEDTPVFGEILPCTPAFHMAYDEDDNRMLSLSMALDLLPYQQQVSNLYSQLNYLLRLQSLVIIALDSDIVPGHIRTEFKKIIEEGQLFAQAQYIELSSQLDDVLDGKASRGEAIKVITANLSGLIKEHYEGINQAIELAERMMMMSPNELGQFNRRETSASETQEVAGSTGVLMDFKSQGIDEARQSWKKIIYDSWMSLGEDDVRLSAPEKFNNAVIEAAGFQVEPESDGYVVGDDKPRTLIGSKESLKHQYSFTSRDGADRPINSESAKVVMELMRYIMGNEFTLKAFVQMYGAESLGESISEVFRMAGSPVILKTNSLYSDKDLLEALEDKDLQAQLQEAMQKVTELEERLAQVEAVAEDYVSQQESTRGPPQGPPQGMPPQGMPEGQPPQGMMPMPQ